MAQTLDWRELRDREAKELGMESDELMVHDAASIYSCPGYVDDEGERHQCNFRAPTLAAVCPTHGVHVA